MDYKADITLNEKDSLQDLLNLEKSMLKIYTTAVSEGASEGFRVVVKRHVNESISDQFEVFKMLMENGYYKVQVATEEDKAEKKQKFKVVLSQLH